MTVAPTIKDSGSPCSGGSEPPPQSSDDVREPSRNGASRLAVVGGARAPRTGTHTHVERRPRVNRLCATRALKQNHLTSSLKRIMTQKEL